MAFQYEKICRLCLNSTNTYIVNIFNAEYNIVEKINDLLSIEVYPNDSFPKVICTDCFSNLVIFQEFKSICKNSDALLKKYQINKVENLENPTENSGGTKGNGKCKSIRNSEEMAQRMKECALKKSLTFVENMKNFYFLLNQIEEMEGTAVIIKEENLIPAVEMSIKNEIIYPPEEGSHQVMITGENNGTLHLNVVQVDNSSEHKRKKRKNSAKQQQQQLQHHPQQQHHQQTHQHQRKTVNINGENLEIIESGTVTTSSGNTTNIVVTTGGSSGETIIVSQKPSDHIQTIHSTNTVTLPQSTQTQTISIIPQIHYSCNECTDTFSSTDTLRQHLWNNHQILFPFAPTTATIETQYQPHHIQAVPVQIQTQSTSGLTTGTATIQPVQQYTFHPHKNYFENSDIPCLLCGMILRTKEELIKHMIKHTSGTSTIVTTATNLTTTNPSQTQTQQHQMSPQSQQQQNQQQQHQPQDERKEITIRIAYECIKCNQSFENENLLKMHNEKFHSTVSS